MTRRASLLRRVSKLEDLEAQRARGQHVTEEVISAALDDLEDAHLLQLEDAAASGRWGPGDAFGGPLALDVLGLEEGAEGPHGWAWAYLSGARRDLPAGCPAAFRARVEDLEDRAADLEDGEEKTRLQDGAAGWAYLEALARVLEARGTAGRPALLLFFAVFVTWKRRTWARPKGQSGRNFGRRC